MALISIEDCPANVQVEPDPKSYAMKYQRKWGGTAVTGKCYINCPGVGRRVQLLFAASDQINILLQCQEKMRAHCEFPTSK
ncbi:MAG: hypothetical protein AAB697_01635 [Patescibacteria group bacterium]